MNGHDTTIEEQELLMERLTWSDDDVVLRLNAQGYRYSLIKRNFFGVAYDASGKQIRMGCCLADHLTSSMLTKWTSAAEGRATVIRPFYSTDGVLFSPTNMVLKHQKAN